MLTRRSEIHCKGIYFSFNFSFDIMFMKREVMRLPAGFYRTMVFCLVVGFTVHMAVLVLDLWDKNLNLNIARYKAIDANCTPASTHTHRVVGRHTLDRDNIQSLWREHTRKRCAALGIGSSLDNITMETFYRSRILVDDKHKILYCQIAKSASTTWRRAFLILSGKLNITNPMAISANDAHHKYDQHLTHLRDLPEEGIIHRLKTYFKFTFVREPFGRLLSAFRNKFVVHTNASTYFKQSFGRKIIRRYRTRQPLTGNASDVQFQEFVNYLIDSKRKIPLNEHWDTFQDLCHPCHISYDFIGKLETFNEDSQYILEKNSLSSIVKIPSRRESRYAHIDTNSYLMKYYSTLTKDSLRQLYTTYKGDFVVFNYTVPNEIKYLM